MNFPLSLALRVLVAAVALAAGVARADEINVINSGGFSAAYKALAPKFEAASGHALSTAWGPSMGQSPEAIPNRLARGEPADVVIMVGYALDELIRQGKVVATSRVELADSRIGLSVRSGVPKPDIATPEGFKAALLQAASIAYSDSASGVYIETAMFPTMGIAAQMKTMAHMVARVPVASVVASGQYAIGLQQVSELLPVAGADFVGKIPESLQSITRFAGGIPVGARHAAAARQLLDFLASPAARADVIQSGLDVIAPVP